MTAVQPAARVDASLAERKNEFAFQGVIRLATPTGSKVTVVLAQLRVSGNSWSAFSAARNTLAPASIINREKVFEVRVLGFEEFDVFAV